MEEILLFLRRVKNDIVNKIDTTADAIAELDADIGETADSGGDVNEGTAMAKLNRLLSKMPLYEEYDIQMTSYTPIETEPLEFLNVSGEAVLIGYSITNFSAATALEDVLTIKTFVDGVVMYDIGYKSTSSTTTIHTFSSFDYKFLFDLTHSSTGQYPLFDLGLLLFPSENHVQGRDVMTPPHTLVKPPIARNSLIVEAFIKPEFVKIAQLSIIYGVKK